jgi:O-antigen/teichoic acid export membrane protein
MSTSGEAARPESLARRLIRASAQYSAGQIVSMLASIARVALSARVLGAEAGGIWLGLQLVMSYGSNLHLGSVFGLFRGVPLLKAQGKDEEAEREKETSFSFVLLATACSAPILFFAARKLSPGASTRQLVGTVVLIGITLLRGYYNTVLKAESRFKELAAAYAFGAFVSLFGLLLIWRYKLDGLIAATGLQMAVETLYYHRLTGAPRLAISRRILWLQIRVGFVTLLTSLGMVLLTTVDRSVMLQRLGAEATGFYYIGANVMLLMPVIIALPAAVLTPQFFERFGRGEDVTPLVTTPVRLASWMFAALVALGAISIPPVVMLMWPALSDGISAAQVAMFTTYPLVLAGLVANVYYAHDKQGIHVVILFASAAVGFGLAHLGVILTHAIVGAALGACAAMYLYFPLCTIGAFWVVGRWREGASLAASTYIPIFYAGILVVGVQQALAHTALSPIVRGICGVAVVALGVTPLLARVQRDVRERLRGR